MRRRFRPGPPITLRRHSEFDLLDTGGIGGLGIFADRPQTQTKRVRYKTYLVRRARTRASSEIAETSERIRQCGTNPGKSPESVGSRFSRGICGVEPEEERARR